MPKVWSDQIFYTTITEPKTGATFTIAFSSWSHTLGNAYTWIELPEGAVRNVEFTKTREGYFGLETRELKVVIDASVPLPGNFVGMLMDFAPPQDVSFTLNYTWKQQQVTITYKGGNIVHLNGMLNFCGIQKSGIEVSYNVDDQTIELTFVDACRVVLENIPMSVFTTLWAHEPLGRKIYIEYIGQKFDWVLLRYITPKGTGSKTIYFVKWVDFEYWFNQIFNQIVVYLVRSTNYSSGVNFPEMPTFYKQDYDFSGYWGTTLTKDDLWVAGVYASETNSDSTPKTIDGGFFPQLAEDFATAWDFLQDFSKTCLSRQLCYATTSFLVNSSPSYSFNLTPRDFDYINLANSIKFGETGSAGYIYTAKTFDYGGSSYQRVDASLVETVADDIDHIEVRTASSRAEATLDVPVLFFTAVTQAKFPQAFEIADIIPLASEEMRNYGIYYWDYVISSSFEYKEIKGLQMIRCHERPTINLTTTTSDTIYNPPPLDYRSDPSGVTSATFADKMQKIHSLASVIANTLATMLGNAKISKLQAEIYRPISWDFDSFVITPSELNPNGNALFDNAPTKYVVQKVVLKMMTYELNELEGLSLGE